jgi:hypothetical protein
MPGDAEMTSWAREPLDEVDARLLDQIARLHSAHDPMPPGLVDRLVFGLTVATLDAELAELQSVPLALASRDDETAEVRSLTFTSSNLTTLVKVSPSGPDRVRIDGWVAPGADSIVELHQGIATRGTVADQDGQFVFDDVPHGPTRFTIRHPGPPADHLVETPIVDI